MTRQHAGRATLLSVAALVLAGCASAVPVERVTASGPASVAASTSARRLASVAASRPARVVEQLDPSCRDISVAELMEEYRTGAYEIAIADIGAIDEPKRVALGDGDLVYSKVEFTGVSAVFGPVAAMTSPALSLGGTAGGLTVVTERPSGLVPGQRAVLVLGRTAGVGETLSDAYLVTGGSVILDGVCQQPGDLPTTPAGASAKKLISTPETMAAGPSDAAVAVDLQAFLAVARA